MRMLIVSCSEASAVRRATGSDGAAAAAADPAATARAWSDGLPPPPPMPGDGGVFAAADPARAPRRGVGWDRSGGRPPATWRCLLLLLAPALAFVLLGLPANKGGGGGGVALKSAPGPAAELDLRDFDDRRTSSIERRRPARRSSGEDWLG